MRTLFHPARKDISLPNVLYALSDPIRLAIVAQLASMQEGISCGDCFADEHIAKSTQSHHFKALREAGLTRSVPRGTRTIISLRRDDLDELFPGLLDSVLGAYEANKEPDIELTHKA